VDCIAPFYYKLLAVFCRYSYDGDAGMVRRRVPSGDAWLWPDSSTASVDCVDCTECMTGDGEYGPVARNTHGSTETVAAWV